MTERFCVYCTEFEYCNYEVQMKSYKCKKFQGNLDFTLRIRIIRFFYWLFKKNKEKILKENFHEGE